MNPTIGTKIPTSPVKFQHCGTNFPIWIESFSMPSLGQIKTDIPYCFAYGNNNVCLRFHLIKYGGGIKVRNCGQYILYYLSDASTFSAYCVE